MRNYKKYRVWHLAHEVVLDTYALAEKLPSTERYGLAAQMKRASVSISSNVAEGAAKGSDADFGRFLLMANGSANELESQLLAVRDLRFRSVDGIDELLEQVDQVRRCLIQLIKATN